MVWELSGEPLGHHYDEALWAMFGKAIDGQSLSAIRAIFDEPLLRRCGEAMRGNPGKAIVGQTSWMISIVVEALGVIDAPWATLFSC